MLSETHKYLFFLPHSLLPITTTPSVGVATRMRVSYANTVSVLVCAYVSLACLPASPNLRHHFHWEALIYLTIYT